MAEFDTKEFLAHHGIKGQKWGVSNGPPYPLKSGQKSYSEKKASKKKSVKDEITKKVSKAKAAIKQKTEEVKGKYTQKRQASLTEYLRDHPKKIVKYKRILTDAEAKKIIDRIEFDRKLEDIRDSEIQRGRDRFKSKVAHTQEIKNLLINSKGIYNASAGVLNAMIDANVIDPNSLGAFVKNGKVIKID